MGNAPVIARTVLSRLRATFQPTKKKTPREMLVAARHVEARLREHPAHDRPEDLLDHRMIVDQQDSHHAYILRSVRSRWQIRGVRNS